MLLKEADRISANVVLHPVMLLLITMSDLHLLGPQNVLLVNIVIRSDPRLRCAIGYMATPKIGPSTHSARNTSHGATTD